MGEQPKVFEYAKKIGIEPLALMDKIREWKLPVKSHMASLSNDIISEIETLLSKESPTPKKAKKTKSKAKAKTTTEKKAKTKAKAKAKTVKKKTTETTKKKVVKKTITKKILVAQSISKKEAQPESPKSDEAPKKTVIRRRAQPKESIEKDAIKSPGELTPLSHGALETTNTVEQKGASRHNEGSTALSPSVSSLEGSPDLKEPGDTTEKKTIRGNIVGRMDLKRVLPSAQNRENKSSSPRPQTATPRNIRTGFVAIPTAPVYDNESTKATDKSVKKKPGTGGTGKELPVQTFTATEFRKREVIFQPKRKRPGVKDGKKTQLTTPKESKRRIQIHNTIKVSELAQKMGIKSHQLVKKLITEGLQAQINTDLDFETVSLIVPEFGFDAENLHVEIDQKVETTAFGELDAESITRPPIITVMGHVDHGKTTLLDAIRSADVVSGEAGGITQHIGAYRVTLTDGKVATFIDTPGHAAFTAMRARGANLTDIVVLVVAADDGIMPQTEEAINHAKAAKVPIIVAINKMDRPGANVEKIKQQLMEHELVPEEWGGATLFSEVSALKKEGISDLINQIHLVAEMQEIKANPKRSATGSVIESSIKKGRGNVATLLVKEGTLKVGDYMVAGLTVGRIRRMSDENGHIIKEAGPGVPVEASGLETTPGAGDRFDVCETEDLAREISQQRMLESQTKETKSNQNLSLEDLFSKANSGDVKELAIVLKSDVAGSNEAIKGMFSKIIHDELKINVIHTGVGGISESDVLLANTSKGVVIGFNVRPDTTAQRISKEKHVEIKTYSIIYELIDDVKKSLSGLLSPDIIEKSQGQAEVREIFSIPKLGVIAGCSVLDGKISRTSKLRLIRDGRVIYEGELGSLKRFKEDVKEVANGYECGIGIASYNDIKVGDVIEAFINEEVSRTLE